MCGPTAGSSRAVGRPTFTWLALLLAFKIVLIVGGTAVGGVSILATVPRTVLGRRLVVGGDSDSSRALRSLFMASVSKERCSSTSFMASDSASRRSSTGASGLATPAGHHRCPHDEEDAAPAVSGGACRGLDRLRLCLLLFGGLTAGPGRADVQSTLSAVEPPIRSRPSSAWFTVGSILGRRVGAYLGVGGAYLGSACSRDLGGKRPAVAR